MNLVVVADSGPILAYAQANRFSLLTTVIPAVIVPDEVYREIVEAGANRPGAREVASGTWATRQTVNPASLLGLSPRLDPGEREAVALARELGCLLLIDDGTGRKEARRLGIRYITSLTVLRDAKRLGLIDAVKPTLDLLVAHDFWLGSAVYQEFLSINGET